VNNSENNDWLHRNDSYHPMQIDKENLGTILFYYYEFFPRLWCYCIIYVLHKQERMMPWPILMNVANSSVRSAFDSANIMNNHSENESKRLYFRERYKNMTTDERKVRHERQRLHNSEPTLHHNPRMATHCWSL
jgi:hypothetical protein